MENYAYTARDEMGKVVNGTLMADSEIDLANKISHMGYFLVRAKPASAQASSDTSKPGNISQRELLDFTIELATLLNAGMPLVSGLKDLAEDAEKDSIKKIVNDVRYRIESGSSLKDALSAYPESFPKLYTSIVSAGESTGRLPACLNDLTALLEWQLELKAKVREASTYPVILFSVMVLVVTILVVKVIPTFEPIFNEAGAKLPPPTQAVLALSRFVRSYWYVILGGLGLAFVGYKFAYKTPEGKYRLDDLNLRLPLFGGLLRKIILSRFCHTFALSLKSGVNVLSSLDIARDVLGNAKLERSVEKARNSINIGEKISKSLQISNEFPALVIRMIAVGEQSGSLIQTLEKVNQFYDREVMTSIKRIFALFEPIMVVIMGFVVGGIAISIFLPMFKMAELMGK